MDSTASQQQAPAPLINPWAAGASSPQSSGSASAFVPPPSYPPDATAREPAPLVNPWTSGGATGQTSGDLTSLITGQRPNGTMAAVNKSNKELEAKHPGTITMPTIPDYENNIFNHGMISQDPRTGQNYLNTPGSSDIAPSWFPDPGTMVTKGVRDGAVGLATLPLDVIDYLAGTHSAQAVRHFVPEVRPHNAAEDIGGSVVQYAVPAGAGAKVAKGVVAPILENASPIAQKIGGYLASLTGAGAGTAAATDPNQAGNLETTLGVGPLQINPDDSALTKRAKVGAEVPIVAPVGDALGTVASRLGGALHEMFGRWTTTGRQAIHDRDLYQRTVDPQAAIANIDQAKANGIAGDGYQPLSGSLSGDPGIIAEERRLAGTPEIKGRIQANDSALSQQLGQTLDASQGPAPQVAADFIAGQRKGMADAVDQSVAGAQGKLGVGQQELADAQKAVSDQAGTAPDASAKLSTVIDEQNQNLMGKQRELYGAAKAGDDSVPTAPFHKAAQAVIDDIGSLGDAAKDPKLAAIVRDMQKLAPPSSEIQPAAGGFMDGKPAGPPQQVEGKVSVSDLIDLSTRLTRQIQDARANRLGGTVEQLSNLKQTVNDELQKAADAGGTQAQAALEGQAFHRTEVAPRFRTGPGGEINDAALSGEPVPPTAVGSKFLGANGKGGAREAAQQLDTILKGAPSEAAGRQAARDFQIGRLADDTVGQKVTPEQLDRWLADNSESLKLTPEVKTEIQQMRNRLANKSSKVAQLDRDLAAAQEARAGTRDALAEDPNKVFDTNDPVTAVGKALSSGNADQQMAQLVAAAKKDPTGAAMDALRNAVKEHLNPDLRNTGKTLTSDNSVTTLSPEDLKASFAKANAMLLDGSPQRKALERVFTPDEMASLDLYRKRFDISERRNSQGLAGSGTGEMDAARDAERNVTDIARASDPLGGGHLARLARLVERTWVGDDPDQLLLKLRKDALLDPNAARAILSAQDIRAQNVTKRHLQNYFTANQLLGKGQNEKDQQR